MNKREGGRQTQDTDDTSVKAEEQIKKQRVREFRRFSVNLKDELERIERERESKLADSSIDVNSVNKEFGKKLEKLDGKIDEWFEGELEDFRKENKIKSGEIMKLPLSLRQRCDAILRRWNEYKDVIDKVRVSWSVVVAEQQGKPLIIDPKATSAELVKKFREFSEANSASLEARTEIETQRVVEEEQAAKKDTPEKNPKTEILSTDELKHIIENILESDKKVKGVKSLEIVELGDKIDLNMKIEVKTLGIVSVSVEVHNSLSNDGGKITVQSGAFGSINNADPVTEKTVEELVRKIDTNIDKETRNFVEKKSGKVVKNIKIVNGKLNINWILVEIKKPTEPTPEVKKGTILEEVPPTKKTTGAKVRLRDTNIPGGLGEDEIFGEKEETSPVPTVQNKIEPQEIPKRHWWQHPRVKKTLYGILSSAILTGGGFFAKKTFWGKHGEKDTKPITSEASRDAETQKSLERIKNDMAEMSRKMDEKLAVDESLRTAKEENERKHNEELAKQKKESDEQLARIAQAMKKGYEEKAAKNVPIAQPEFIPKTPITDRDVLKEIIKEMLNEQARASALGQEPNYGKILSGDKDITFNRASRELRNEILNEIKAERKK